MWLVGATDFVKAKEELPDLNFDFNANISYKSLSTS